MAGNASNNKELVLVQDGCMTGPAFRNWSCNRWLGPMGSLEIEDDEVGEVCPVFVFAAKHKKLVAFVQCGRMTCDELLTTTA